MVRIEEKNSELTRTELSDPGTAADRFERRRAADYAAAFGRDAFDWRDQAIPLQAARETAA